jgi:Asp-tRNA(Asn)/Glu-tRNA(Gln) amidotransferase A subunit family amidase
MKLNELTAVEAAAQISAGRITSEQLIRACLDRIAERRERCARVGLYLAGSGNR